MPRLSNKQYLEQRQRLRTSWQHRKAEPFTSLSATEQLRIWAYFAPTQDFSDEELVEYRKLVSEHYPSLPQQAGRAYARVLPYLDLPSRSGPALSEVKPKQRRKAKGRVVVHAKSWPEDERRAKIRRLILKWIHEDKAKREDDEKDKS